jgi:hypothetical protein
VLDLLRDGRTNPDGWLPDERAAVTRFHLWAHGAPPRLGSRPLPSSAGHPDRENDDLAIRAGDRPAPLPSEVLGSLDGGRGIAGWILTPEALDRLPVLTRDPGDGNGDRIDGVPLPGDLVREQLDDAEDRFAEDLLVDLRRLGDTYGPLGVAIAAATLTDPRAVVAQIDPDAPEPGRPTPAHDADGCEANLDALRAEVARLSGLLDDASREAERADRAEQLLAEQRATTETLRRHLDGERARAERAEGLGEETTPRPIEEDPRRPHPDAWPDDAVLLRYAELRRLVALHLERYTNTRVARAMLEGDVPLRLAEVLA